MAGARFSATVGERQGRNRVYDSVIDPNAFLVSRVWRGPGRGGASGIVSGVFDASGDGVDRGPWDLGVWFDAGPDL